jgi:dihydrolipoamide dehydrogenase
VESFDVVVLGAGSAGEALSTELAREGRRVALVEALRVGGECPYVACMPSKSLLRSAQARADARRLTELAGASQQPGLDGEDGAYRRAVERRDEVAEHRDDSDAADGVQEAGVVLVRGRGRVVRDGVVAVDGRELGYRDLVLATGSEPVRPDVPGLEAVPTWTSDEALSAQERPASLLVMGGGAVGCELAQAHVRFGVRTTWSSGPQVAGKEEPPSRRCWRRRSGRTASTCDWRRRSPGRAHGEGLASCTCPTARRCWPSGARRGRAHTRTEDLGWTCSASSCARTGPRR